MGYKDYLDGLLGVIGIIIGLFALPTILSDVFSVLWTCAGLVFIGGVVVFIIAIPLLILRGAANFVFGGLVDRLNKS